MDLDRGRHLGVEHLDMRGTTTQEQQDDRLVSHRVPGSRQGLADREHLGQSESSQAQRADAEKIAAGQALAVTCRAGIGEPEHGWFLSQAAGIRPRPVPEGYIRIGPRESRIRQIAGRGLLSLDSVAWQNQLEFSPVNPPTRFR